MNKVLFIILIMLNSIMVSAQKTYDFDFYNSPSDNELVNNFTVINNYVQVPDSGITGGCIEVVRALNFAEATLDQPIQWMVNDELRASVFFKFVSDTFSSIQTEDISMNILIKDINGNFTDSSYSTRLMFDFNNVQNSVLPLTRLSYWMNTAAILSNYVPDSFFVDYHWYQMEISLDKNFTGDTVAYNYVINDFGKSGLSKVREIVRFQDKHGWSATLKQSNEVKLKLRSNPLGSVRYIDNLSVNGFPTKLYDLHKKTTRVLCYPNPFSATINLVKNTTPALDIEVYDMQGRKILSDSFSKRQHVLNLEEFASNTYMIVLKKDNVLIQSMLIVKK